MSIAGSFRSDREKREPPYFAATEAGDCEKRRKQVKRSTDIVAMLARSDSEARWPKSVRYAQSAGTGLLAQILCRAKSCMRLSVQPACPAESSKFHVG